MSNSCKSHVCSDLVRSWKRQLTLEFKLMQRTIYLEALVKINSLIPQHVLAPDGQLPLDDLGTFEQDFY